MIERATIDLPSGSRVTVLYNDSNVTWRVQLTSPSRKDTSFNLSHEAYEALAYLFLSGSQKFQLPLMRFGHGTQTAVTSPPPKPSGSAP